MCVWKKLIHQEQDQKGTTYKKHKIPNLDYLKVKCIWNNSPEEQNQMRRNKVLLAQEVLSMCNKKLVLEQVE